MKLKVILWQFSFRFTIKSLERLFCNKVWRLKEKIISLLLCLTLRLQSLLAFGDDQQHSSSILSLKQLSLYTKCMAYLTLCKGKVGWFSQYNGDGESAWRRLGERLVLQPKPVKAWGGSFHPVWYQLTPGYFPSIRECLSWQEWNLSFEYEECWVKHGNKRSYL